MKRLEGVCSQEQRSRIENSMKGVEGRVCGVKIGRTSCKERRRSGGVESGSGRDCKPGKKQRKMRWRWIIVTFWELDGDQGEAGGRRGGGCRGRKRKGIMQSVG